MQRNFGAVHSRSSHQSPLVRRVLSILDRSAADIFHA